MNSLCRHSFISFLFKRLETGGRYTLTSRYFGMVTRNWERKRFYEEVGVYQSEDGQFGIKLDHRNLRTPARKLFLVPTESLAVAVSQEWESQTKYIQPPLMHLTSLCNTVMDGPAPDSISVVDDALQYLAGDTVCFRTTEPDELVELQVKEWDPILNWFNKRYGVALQATTGLYHITPLDEIINPLSSYIKSLNKWSLVGFHFALRSSKSLVLTCALFEGKTDPQITADLARLEVRHQISKWGSVEWQHEIEAQDLLSRLSASLLLGNLSEKKTNP